MAESVKSAPKVKVKVTYSGGHQPDLDKRIKAVLKSVGCRRTKCPPTGTVTTA